jgi:hypothetical protein
MPLLGRLQNLRGHLRVVARIGRDERLLDLGGQGALVALERQDIAPALRHDLFGDSALTAHGIDGDNASLQVQQRQNLRDGRDLIGLRLGGDLPKHHPVGRRPGADQMQRRQSLAARMRAAQRLPIDGDDLAWNDLTDRLDPVAKARLERLGPQQTEDTPERIVRGDPMGQLQKLPQPRLLKRAPKLRDLRPAIGPAERSRNGNHDHIQQVVTPLERAARVFERRKMPHQGAIQGHVRHRRQHSISKHGRRIIQTLSRHSISRR